MRSAVCGGEWVVEVEKTRRRKKVEEEEGRERGGGRRKERRRKKEMREKVQKEEEEKEKGQKCTYLRASSDTTYNDMPANANHTILHRTTPQSTLH